LKNIPYPFIKCRGRLFFTFFLIPEEFRSEELCLIAVQQKAGALKYVPRKFLTRELCLMALQKDKDVLGYIPKNLYTPEILLIACTQNPLATILFLNNIFR